MCSHTPQPDSDVTSSSSLIFQQQLLENRAYFRRLKLSSELTSIPPEVMRCIIPSFRPECVDFVVFWTISSQLPRQGFCHVMDIPVGPSDNVVRQLLADARLDTKFLQEESRKRKDRILQDLASSELGKGSCPVHIHQATSPQNLREGDMCQYVANIIHSTARQSIHGILSDLNLCCETRQIKKLFAP